MEIIFRPDPAIWDGRFANNGWLQELPKPLTKLTWDSVAMFSPETAQRLGVNTEDTSSFNIRAARCWRPHGRCPATPTKVSPYFSGMAARAPAASERALASTRAGCAR